jgi:tetratricopeptide (TPR) repeat protein
MADKAENIQYTPEELAEIGRITSILPGSDRAPAPVPVPPSFVDEEPAPDLAFAPPSDEEGFSSFDDTPEDDFLSVPGEDEVEDITGMIHELPEEPEASSFSDELLSTDSFDFSAPSESEPAESFDFGSESEEGLPSEESAFPGIADVPSVGRKTARAQLDELTSEEPRSIDAQEVASDLYNPADFEEGESFAPATSESDFPSLDDFTSSAGAGESEIPSFDDEPSVSLGGESAFDVPDLSSLGAGEASEIPEAGIQDIPDIGMDALGSFGGDSAFSAGEDLPSVGDDSGSAFEDMDSFDSSSPAPSIPDSLASEMPDIPSMDDIDDVIATTPIPETPDTSFSSFGDDDHNSAFDMPHEEPTRGGLDLSDAELRRLKNSIILFPPALMRAVKDAILNDTLGEDDTRILVDMIMTGRDDADVQHFLEDRLHRTIEMGRGTSRRRVISSRPEYSSNASRERQRRLFKRTKIAGIAVLIAAVAGVLGYQLIFKPAMAKKLTGDGVALILKKADISDEIKNYNKAEQIFRHINEDYVKNYLPGYNRYARAYFDKKQFSRSLKKLNDAYAIAPANIDTLLNLGFFYKKVPDAFYNDEVKDNLKKMYYAKAPPAVERIRSKYDVAIDFYLKAKTVNPKNITALVGIGDVYFIQGQYLKAREYYESILKVDPDSVAGYSGLMNLFIERDDLPDLLTIYVELREKDLLPEVPLPLLGKLSEYFMSKSAKGDKNVRIEHGVTSVRVKDEKDNLFPAVRTVLAAMHKTDSDYPPLYLHYAKFAMQQNNLVQVKGYLEQAIEHAEERGDKYFGAETMLGEYYYTTKDPAKAYEYFKKALVSALSPAAFTQEEFYSETESTGRTKAMMANVFYYNFDKVTSRFGDSADEADLEEEAPDKDADRMVNYEIAMKKYEDALNDGFESPELHYNLGRIYYLKGLYENSVSQWLNLYEDFTSSPELIFALGNAFYHLNNTESAKAEFQKLINVYEDEASTLTKVIPSRRDHKVMIASLAASYNNLGAVYLKKGSETKSTICFWKAIEYAHKLGEESEFSRLNLARVSKKKGDSRQPVLDENIPFSVDIYRADMR